LTGFVDLRKDPEKFSYDKWTASLTSTTRRFQLGQAVDLNFIGVGQEVIYQTLFKPIADCGLKTPAEKA
jgi:ribonuclease R